MQDIIPAQGGDVQIFDPQRYRLNDAALDYGIEHAKRIKDWPKLEEAVDLKIEEQRKFVVWWNSAVGGNPDGRGRRKEIPGTRYLSFRDAEELTGMKQQRVSALGKKLKTGDKYRAGLLGVNYLVAMLEATDNVRGTQGMGRNEWYTPAKYLELARKVMGEINLDPASSEEAQRTVQADRFFTAADNGLTQLWEGRVWLNPPYAQPLIAQFVSKMCEERAAGRVDEAIMLTHNYTDTAWFQEAMEIADAVCFTRGRIKFLDGHGDECAPTQGQAFTYFGDNPDKFASIFLDVGFVVCPVLFARNAREGWAVWGNEAPPLVPDDGLDIPEFLRRDKAGAA